MTKNYNKDIMDWDKFPPYDILWCDPPWEQGLVKFFHTKMRQAGYTPPDNTIEGIMHQLGFLAEVTKPLVIEYSIKGSELVVFYMERNGHKLVQKIDAIQTNGKPYRIMVFNVSMRIDPTQKGFNLIKDCLSKCQEGLTIFDPFAGIGATAKAVRVSKGSHTYIGSELNPARYERLCKINI